MKAIKKNGLYTVPITIIGNKKQRKLIAMVDTGSVDCVATYKVITTLQIKQRDYSTFALANGTKANYLVYDARIEFDKKDIVTPIVRVSDLPEGIDFIFGMSVLDHCKIIQTDSFLEINWK